MRKPNFAGVVTGIARDSDIFIVIFSRRCARKVLRPIVTALHTSCSNSILERMSYKSTRGKFYEPHNSRRKRSDAVLCVQEQGRLATCSRFCGFNVCESLHAYSVHPCLATCIQEYGRLVGAIGRLHLLALSKSSIHYIIEMALKRYCRSLFSSLFHHLFHPSSTPTVFILYGKSFIFPSSLPSYHPTLDSLIILSALTKEKTRSISSALQGSDL